MRSRVSHNERLKYEVAFDLALPCGRPNTHSDLGLPCGGRVIML